MGLTERMFPDSIGIPATLLALADAALAANAAPHVNLSPELEMSGTDPTIIAQMKAEAAIVPQQVTSTALDEWLNELALETQPSGSYDPINSSLTPPLI